MALTTEQLEKAWPWWVENRSTTFSPCKFTKGDIREGLAAATTWIENNQSSFVSSLASTPFAGANSTVDEKLRLFMAALAHKFNIELGR